MDSRATPPGVASYYALPQRRPPPPMPAIASWGRGGGEPGGGARGGSVPPSLDARGPMRSSRGHLEQALFTAIDARDVARGKIERWEAAVAVCEAVAYWS